MMQQQELFLHVCVENQPEMLLPLVFFPPPVITRWARLQVATLPPPAVIPSPLAPLRVGNPSGPPRPLVPPVEQGQDTVLIGI